MRETKIYLTVTLILAGIVIFSSVKSEEGVVGGVFFVPEDNFPISEDRSDPIPQIKTGRTDIDVTAKAIVVKETSYEIRLMEKNVGEVLPMASLTKLMTALVVWQSASPDDVVEIQPEDVEVIPNKINLVPGEKITVSDLIRGLLVGSGNDAAKALARHTHGSQEKFATVMNHDATVLGMSSTSFENPIGFDDPRHHTTARDMEILVEEFLSYPELVKIAGEESVVINSIDGKYSHFLKNTNELLARFPTVVGLKTGYTEEARENLILLIRDENIEYYVIILGSEDREKDGEKIIQWIDENVLWK